MLVKYLLFQARHVNRFVSYYAKLHQLSRCDIPCHLVSKGTRLSLFFKNMCAFQRGNDRAAYFNSIYLYFSMLAIQKFRTVAYLRTDSQHVAFFLNFDHVCFLTTLASSEIHCNCSPVRDCCVGQPLWPLLVSS